MEQAHVIEILGGRKLEHEDETVGAPDTVEDVAVGEDPDVKVGGEDVVEGADFLVPEEGVGHPDFAGVGEGEVANPL